LAGLYSNNRSILAFALIFASLETLNQILNTFRKANSFRTLLNWMNDPDQRVTQLTGMAGAQLSFILAAMQEEKPASHMVIATDKEEAAYWFNNLEAILENKQIWFLPDSFKRPGNFDELNNTQVLQRSETINQFTSGLAKANIMVTYPEALFECVVAPDKLRESRIDIGIQEKLDLDFLTEVLHEYGFERTDFVYEPGQFSIRGCIVDIFSYGNEMPYRIELFDDIVERIRLFDPEDQLSKRTIARVLIVPNLNTRFEREDKVPIFALLDPEVTIWTTQLSNIQDRLQICFDAAKSYAGKLHDIEDEALAKILNERVFVRPAEALEGISSFKNIVLQSQDKKYDHQIVFQGQAQPDFHRKFDLLIENLHLNEKEGLKTYIFTDNPRQIERLYSIFEDLKAEVRFEPVLISIDQGFVDKSIGVACYTDHQIFQRYHTYRLRKRFSRDQAISMKLLKELQPGDFVTHIDHGVGRYSGLEQLNINGQIQEAVRIVYQNNDLLYVGINSLHKLSKYVGKEGTEPKIHKLGSDAWKNLKQRTKSKVKDIAAELIKLYAKRRASKGHAFGKDNYLQHELEASFIYEDTPDQLKATQDVKEDMSKPYPMDRLICGDVGFGKTEVAVRAAFKAVVDGKQVAILVPTTILALQHHRTFGERLSEFGCKVDYINRFRSAADKKRIASDLKSGKIDIIIGTHGILSKEIGFKDLGLLIIDEEQKFGVGAKEKLRSLKVNVDTLTLTATPIPRTLQFSLMAARDLSIIRTPPPNRQPIHTEVRVFNDDLIQDAIYTEVNRGGQVFFVHNRVKSLPDMAAMVQKLCPDVSVGTVHGQVDPKVLENTLVDFIDGKFDVLVSTNIIETGLDIPNVNTIIINNAHQFGMSDLHQLRGRVGRSNRKAYCFLFAPPLSVLTTDARKRLKTLEEFTDLGSGFNIAMRDLDIRGSGNLLGAEQSGFIAEIGYDSYQKVLEEAIAELKENEFRDVFKEELEKSGSPVRFVQIETDVEMHIPDSYVVSIQERLSLYTELDALENEVQIEEFQEKLKDRFGPMPPQVLDLFEGLRLRWIARQMGMERLFIKNGKLMAYFLSNPAALFFEQPLFQAFLKVMVEEGSVLGVQLRNDLKTLGLHAQGVKTLQAATQLMAEIYNRCQELVKAQGQSTD
jgi:transcription-repair coupling factor (superfamily II helicase)